MISPPVDTSPIVTIVIPLYNHEQFVARAIRSAIEQTYPRCEILVVNDGSTDGSEAVARGFGPLVQVISQKNQGLAGARNAGITAAKGEFLVFLDADDWLELHAVSRLMEVMLSLPEDYGLVASRNNTFRDGKMLADTTALRRPTSKRLEITWKDLVLRSRFSPSVLVRRTAFEKVGLFDAQFGRLGCEDRDMWVRIARCYRICQIDDRLLNYTLHGSNMSGDPAKQLPGTQRFMAKAYADSLVPHWRLDFWGKAYAIFHFQAAIMYRDVGRNGSDLLHTLLSVILYPLPGIHREMNQRAFCRLRRLGSILLHWRRD